MVAESKAAFLTFVNIFENVAALFEYNFTEIVKGQIKFTKKKSHNNSYPSSFNKLTKTVAWNCPQLFLFLLHPNSTLCFLQTSSLPPIGYFFRAPRRGRGNKRAQVALVFIHWRRSRQTNKQSERPALLFGVDCILYSIIPKRGSFVVKDWVNCRVW